MKADMALDYALFQLDSTRTRCELWISAGGVTEKLASGLLKPFLDHLRAAQEQISSGAQSIRLQAPSVTANGRNSGAAWFSKGTMERFVRFVSIPEVLERVSAVEAECQRLEEAINILASESGDDHHLFDTTSVPVQPGIKPVDGKSAAKTGESRKLKQDYHDISDTTGDTSKRQLLRAMDGRRAMLQKEQRKALAQAVAAGFNMECMSNLVVFADCFGAIQLREACAKFMALRKKIQEFGSLIDEMELAAETVSTGLKMNRSGIVLLDSENSGAAMPATGFLDKPFENQRDSGGDFDDTHEKLVISSTDNRNHDKLGESGDRIIKGRTSASKIGSSRVPNAFKRQLGMPHLHSNVRDHVMKLSVDKLEYGMDRVENIECRQMGIKTDIPDGEDCRSLGATDNCFSSSGVPANFSPPEIKTADSLCDTCIVPEKDLPSDEETNCSTDNDTRRSARRSSSPTRRSVSPRRKVQIGRPPVHRQGVVVMKTFSHLSSNSQEAGYTKHTDDKGSEDSESDKDTESKINCDEEKQDSKSEHRRLSVQDAINLFERKKKESVELPLPKVSGCDGQRDVLETGKRLAPVKDVLRRWNVAGDPGPESATKPSKTDSTRENLEVDLSAKHVKPNNHDNGDTGDRPHAKDVGKSEKLPSVEAAINGDGLPAEHDMEQKQLSVKPRTMQFDSAPSSQQLLQNSKLQALHAISVPPEHEKQNIRRWSLPTPPFHSTFNTEPVKLDSHSDVVKDSSLDNGQALKQTVVKGVGPSDKELRVEQKKPKHYPSAELGLNGNSTVHRQASTVEDAGLDKPQELSWKGTNIPKRLNQQEVKERLKAAGFQIEQSPTMSASDDLSEKSTSKGTVRRSWSTPSDFHLEALAKMVDNKDNEDEDHELTSGGGNPKDLKGIFYEQYRQKRDAKLRQESGFKRAEREAKMKAMQEAFERSKEELTARSNRFSENNTAYIEDSGRMGRIQSLKAGPLKSKRESLSTPILQDSQSASSTRIGKHVNSRQNTARKISPSAQKSSSSATAAPGTTRAAGSPSQKSIPKNSSPSGARSSQRRGSSGSPAKTSENMLKSSAPLSAELQKELTKPSLGHRVHSSHQEKGSTLRGLPYKDAERAFNLMGVALPDSLGQMSESMREIQKSISSSDEIEQDGTISPSGFSAKDRLAEPASEAGKIFLQENDEFRPESQPDKVIMKSSFVPDAVKINYEEDFSSSSSNMAPFESEEPDSISPGEDEETSSIAEQLSATKETIHPLDIANEEASSFYLGDHNVSASGQDGSKDPQDEALSTSQMSQKFLASLDNQDSHLRVPISNFVEPGKPPLPSLFALHSKEMFQNSKMSSYDINVARSFSSPPKDSQLPGILNAEDRDSFLGSVPVSSFHTSQLPLKLSENHHDSPTVSSIKFDQIQSRKTWNNSQKAVSLNSQHIQKESSKGFKRLLKFGRRSRGSEPTTQDWIAASTSEGDEDGDESKDYFGEDDFRASGNDSRNAYKHTERISKVTDIDGVNGTGPRSFFSLSSFRSKSSESRSRA